MWQTLHMIVFGIYPYVTLAVFVVGCIIRYDRAPYSWRAQSSQLLRRRLLMTGSVFFHAGILIVFLGHLVGLLTPVAVFEWIGIGHGTKQMASMVIGGFAGAIALVGGLLLLYRRVADPRIRRMSTSGDVAIIAILNLQLVLGLSTILVSIDHLDGAEMLKFMAWAQGILILDISAPSLIADVHWIYKVHLFLGLTIFLVFPFTRLVHMLSAPVHYLWRPGHQIVRMHGDPKLGGAGQLGANLPGSR